MSELHESCWEGNLASVEECLRRGVNPSEPDPEWGGRTPLHLACSRGHSKCVYVLLAGGADPNARTECGWTPAHCACETGQVQCLSVLVQCGGCDLALRDAAGDDPARVADVYGHKECAHMIREQQTNDKNTSIQ